MLINAVKDTKFLIPDLYFQACCGKSHTALALQVGTPLLVKTYRGSRVHREMRRLCLTQPTT